MEGARFSITGSDGVIKRSESTRQTPNLPFQIVNQPLLLTDSSRSPGGWATARPSEPPAGGGLGLGLWVLACASVALRRLHRARRGLLSCRRHLDLSLGPGKGRPAGLDSQMCTACGGYVCKATRFLLGAEFSPSGVPCGSPRSGREPAWSWAVAWVCTHAES